MNAGWTQYIQTFPAKHELKLCTKTLTADINNYKSLYETHLTWPTSKVPSTCATTVAWPYPV